MAHSPLCFVWGGASPAESCVRRAPLCFLLLPTIISFPPYQRKGILGCDGCPGDSRSKTDPGARTRALTLPGMPAASKRGARRRSAVSTRLRSCPNRRHLGGCCGAAAGGAATGRQIQRSGHPPAIHWKGTKAPLSAIHRRSRLSKQVTPSMRTSRRSWTRETSPPLSSRGTVHAGRPRTLPSTLAFISPTASRECSRRHH